MKREEPQRQADQATEEPAVEREAPAADAEAGSETYLAGNEVPAVVEPAIEAASVKPTASEQAFAPEETPEQADQKTIKAAQEYNDDRPHNVAEFNQLTESSCMKHGQLDIEKIRDFQKAAHLEADGRIGPWTLAAAKRTADDREKTKSEEKAVAAASKAKKVMQVPAQEAVLAPAFVAEPVVAKADAAEGTVTTELAKDGQKHQAAIEFNERHAAIVAEFNTTTNFACTEGGNVVIEKVIEFQIAHGCKADGKIDAQTLSAAKTAAEPITQAQLEAAPKVDVVREMA